MAALYKQHSPAPGRLLSTRGTGSFFAHPAGHTGTRRELSFYLQNGSVKDCVDNTMVFMEVGDLDQFWDDLVALDLPGKYKNVKVTPIKVLSWGRECFVHDPSGILWHFGEFVK